MELFSSDSQNRDRVMMNTCMNFFILQQRRLAYDLLFPHFRRLNFLRISPTAFSADFSMSALGSNSYSPYITPFFNLHLEQFRSGLKHRNARTSSLISVGASGFERFAERMKLGEREANLAVFFGHNQRLYGLRERRFAD
jgi:hypothetical protein